jgi:chaperone modulatory protein CbpM
MTVFFSEEEAIAEVARLTRSRMATFVDMDIVAPLPSGSGLTFREADLVRMELLCEIAEVFDIRDEGLAVVISLIDQVHAVRGDLDALLLAIKDEPFEVRQRIAKRAISPAHESG